MSLVSVNSPSAVAGSYCPRPVSSCWTLCTSNTPDLHVGLLGQSGQQVRRGDGPGREVHIEQHATIAVPSNRVPRELRGLGESGKPAQGAFVDVSLQCLEDDRAIFIHTGAGLAFVILEFQRHGGFVSANASYRS